MDSTVLKTFAKYPNLIRSDDDVTWAQWLGCHTVDVHSLAGIVKHDRMKDCFKARALALLLAPRARWTPVAIPKTERDDASYFNPIDLPVALSIDLIRFVADMLCEVIDLVNAGTTDVHWTKGLRYACQTGIPILLSRLPYEEGEALFTRYEWLDPVPHMSDEVSGYNPYIFFMTCFHDLDERWKRRADAIMRTNVLAEVRGERKPRRDWEEALWWYMDLLSNQAANTLRYSSALLMDQLEFLLLLPEDSSQDMFGRTRLAWALSQIPEEAFEDLGYRLARRVILLEKGPFRIFDVDGLRMAERLRAAFGEKDAQLASVLETAIHLAEPDIEQSTRSQQWRQTVDAMMSR
jgi:hypothetical protein